ncbi:hypothetical protein Dsin_022786 [Dipteronia sinensis]|uniref:DUF4283 domain-containing protein n=1 Tax=Dipteronia sinensis TaxID=43782 RepID=A0AAE0A3N5_9ROSI|nr:hypothetical protein Dsin_022786 [Dipteronia sinensis]
MQEATKPCGEELNFGSSRTAARGVIPGCYNTVTVFGDATVFPSLLQCCHSIFVTTTVPATVFSSRYSAHYNIPSLLQCPATVFSLMLQSATVIPLQYFTAPTVSRTMVFPLLHGLAEDPMSLEAILSSSPHTSSTTTPICSEGTPSKKGGFVSIRVDLIAYQSRLELCKNALIGGLVLASGERSWMLVDLKAKFSKHWLISADWRLISLGKSYFQIILKSFGNKNKNKNKIIFDLARGIGVSLRLDKATIDGDFGHYARVLVDVDMSALLPSSVLLERDEFHSSFISVEYENLPSFCSICSSIGHLPGSCHWIKSKVPAASAGKSSQPMAEASKMVYRQIDIDSSRGPSFQCFCCYLSRFGAYRFNVEADDLDSDGLAQRTMIAKRDCRHTSPSFGLLPADPMISPQTVLCHKQHLTVSISTGSLMHWFTFVYASTFAYVVAVVLLRSRSGRWLVLCHPLGW